jgi:FkbM family methyltransferase
MILSNKIKSIIRDTFRIILLPLGQTTVSILQTYDENRRAVLERRAIDLVIDVGANVGQYAKKLRKDGYRGSIISVEPLPDVFARLSGNMANDALWKGHQAAAGGAAGTAQINVSADSVCSSLLKPAEALTSAIKTAHTVQTIDVPVMRLDDIDTGSHNNIVLKLDVQGFEKHAMAGATKLLDKISVLEIELAITPGYDGAYTLRDALPDILSRGFSLVSIGRGVSDGQTGKLLDVDIIFER